MEELAVRGGGERSRRSGGCPRGRRFVSTTARPSHMDRPMGGPSAGPPVQPGQGRRDGRAFLRAECRVLKSDRLERPDIRRVLAERPPLPFA